MFRVQYTFEMKPQCQILFLHKTLHYIVGSLNQPCTSSGIEQCSAIKRIMIKGPLKH